MIKRLNIFEKSVIFLPILFIAILYSPGIFPSSFLKVNSSGYLILIIVSMGGIPPTAVLGIIIGSKQINDKENYLFGVITIFISIISLLAFMKYILLFT